MARTKVLVSERLLACAIYFALHLLRLVIHAHVHEMLGDLVQSQQSLRMVLAVTIPHHIIHVLAHLQRLFILLVNSMALCQTVQPKKALAARPRQFAHPRPQLFREPRPHHPFEALPAGLTRRPCQATTMSLLEHRIDVQAVEVPLPRHAQPHWIAGRIHPHRYWDGTSCRPKDDSTKAIEDDTFRSMVIRRLLIPSSKKYPHVHITIENPFLSLILEMDDVKELLKEHGWQVSRADHCIVANPAFDSIVTQKPTTYVTFGYQSFNKVCCKEQRCKFMIPGTDFHKYVIRNSNRAPKEQQRVNDSVLRSRIARGARAFIRSMQLPTALNCAPEPADSTENCRPRRRTVIPEAILQLWHRRLGHCGRDRLCRALRDYALTKSYIIPRNFQCRACDVSNATRKSHCGNLQPAEYPNQMYYCDLINFLVRDIHAAVTPLSWWMGNLGGSLPTRSRPSPMQRAPFRSISRSFEYLQSVYESMQEGSSRVKQPTGLVHLCRTTGIRLEVVTPGEHEAHGIVERANRTLTRMACAMLTSANLGMEYWSYVLRHAAHCDAYLSSSDSLPTPYSFWHGVLETPRRNIAFGAPLLCRQQEKSKQHKLDARAHPAVFLGFANDHGAVYVLDKAVKSSPIRMTCHDLKRSYCEELVVDYTSGLVINPETLTMMANSTGELTIQEVPAEEGQPPLSPEQEKKLKETMDFYTTRRAELHANTSMTARQVETTILREFKVEELRRLQCAEDNLNQESTREPTIGKQQSEEPQPTVEQQARKLTKQQLRELQVSDVPCCLCASGHFDDPVTSKRPKRQHIHLLICESCNRGFHTSCLELHWQPGFSDDDWLCFDSLIPGTQVEIPIGNGDVRRLPARKCRFCDRGGVPGRRIRIKRPRCLLRGGKSDQTGAVGRRVRPSGGEWHCRSRVHV